jgi:hypothetical protein
MLILAIAGARRRHAAGRTGVLDAVLFASLASLTVVSALYFPTTRMSAPLDPMLMAYAACAFGAGSIRRR